MEPKTLMHSKIIAIVCETLTLENVESDQDLIEEGVLDSLALIQLMVALEEGFNIKIEPEELDMEDYRTVDNMTSLIYRTSLKEVFSQYG